ncbi:MAG: peptidoglycan-binding LysM-like protein [Hydrogenophilales bacterium 16-64-46]|nr:MAG: peptidoglycan-binding LysM-like protein [Hydrogenophilales bacterium 12-64-13]OYZ06789.1 MAG: peptidoglycan-binding LysM-like protein [Hydrogenophilales bacterium 16-64-46]OZA39496.1 MAG: peptidoglycan-binding LysM-like protein [Hydrogenophilales bacterium 17-64-34]HQS99804.1 LysM peptidoglycan-binding domain-containing protein [Thiobacillus sp.]
MRHLIASLALVLAAPAFADTLKLQDNAPDRYVVVKGDTLWDISGKFLKDPWRWPQIWNLNRAEIKDPHWIYPGDLIVLDRSGKEPRLSLVKGDKHGMTTVKLSPGVRTTEIGSDAIPAIPIRVIHPFLTQPRVVAKDAMDSAPFILGTNAERVVLGAGDDAFATGGPAGVTRWNVLRPGKTLKDPETGEVLGYEVEYLGDARTLAEGAPQKIRITQSAQEILPKDKLVAADETTTFEFLPHAPEAKINARIISAYGGMTDSGRYQTVVLNRGSRDGIESGHVLAVYREGQAVQLTRDEQEKMTWASDKPATAGDGAWLYNDVRCLKPGATASAGSPPAADQVFRATCLSANDARSVKLPDARSGLLMVYRVFDRVAYALIMQSDGPVYLLDTARNP